jgi:hypothetical protein
MAQSTVAVPKAKKEPKPQKPLDAAAYVTMVRRARERQKLAERKLLDRVHLSERGLAAEFLHKLDLNQNGAKTAS